MGYILFTARKLMLTSRLNTLNLQEMLISQSRMGLLQEQLKLQMSNGDVDSELEQIATKENILDLQMKAIETQIKAIQEELESVEKAEEKQIEMCAPKFGQ